MPGQNRPILYHFPLSPYSMRVRLVLAEKDIDWESRVVDIINMENYEPWYVSMCAHAEVPAFVRGDEVIVQSEQITRHLDASFPGQKLLPEDASFRRDVEGWVERATRFPMESLHAALSSPRQLRMESRLFGARIKALRGFAKRRPDLESRYQAKIDDIERKSALASSPMPREEALALVGAELDDLNNAFTSSEWIAGDAYSMADVFWTVALARLSMIGEADSFSASHRPHLASWWQRIRARPSFERADIWLRMRPFSMAPYVFRLLRSWVTG